MDSTEIALPEMTGPQLEILEATDRAVLAEGSPRSAKSWGACFKIWMLALQHPGIRILYGREHGKGLGALREIWGYVAPFFPDYLQPVWNPTEQAWDFPAPDGTPDPPPGQHYGSRVYLMPFASADQSNYHSAYKSKTVAVVVGEEASEMGPRRYKGLKERLSQSTTPWGEPYNYPLQILLVTNCVDTDHWLAKDDGFPLIGEVCPKPGHRYIRADLYSNAHNLGEAVIAGYEQDYPPGHPERRTIIEGRRGLTILGTPVYGKEFKRDTHVAPVFFNPYYPLLEGWDFGQEKPAVTWWQYLEHQAALRLLGAVKGSEIFLEQFAPAVLQIRQRLFPHATTIRSHCDPTGATGNQGLKQTAVELLHQLGIPVIYDTTANEPPVRDKAIQTTAGYMLRQSVDGTPAFLMAPTCIELVWQGESIVEQVSTVHIDSFQAGYVWDDRAPSDRYPNIRKPKKGTRYDDLQNAGEYIVIGERIPMAPTVAQLATAAARYQTAPDRVKLQQALTARRAQREQQRDTHPVDGATVRGGRMRRRGFY